MIPTTLEAVAEINAQHPSKRGSTLARVFVVAENRLLREELARLIGQCATFEIAGNSSISAGLAEALSEQKAEIVLWCARRSLADDLRHVLEIRWKMPEIRVVLIHGSTTSADFLQSVRAGIRGYLTETVSAREVLEAIRKVQAGEAVCSGKLCLYLFEHLQEEAEAHCRTLRHAPLTYREQQLMMFVYQGLSNKEIAHRVSVSEQTIKNHLHRIKWKVGAADRRGIVDACLSQGILTVLPQASQKARSPRV